MDHARIFVQIGDAWRDIDTQELSEKGTGRADWKCHLCSFNDGNTGPMFKLVNAHKVKLCCRDCARMPGMIDILFDSNTAFKLHQYLQDNRRVQT